MLFHLPLVPVLSPMGTELAKCNINLPESGIIVHCPKRSVFPYICPIKGCLLCHILGVILRRSVGLLCILDVLTWISSAGPSHVFILQLFCTGLSCSFILSPAILFFLEYRKFKLIQRINLSILEPSKSVIIL